MASVFTGLMKVFEIFIKELTIESFCSGRCAEESCCHTTARLSTCDRSMCHLDGLGFQQIDEGIQMKHICV